MSTPQARGIYKDVKGLFKTCRGDKSGKTGPESESGIKFNKEEREVLHLSEDLVKFSKKYKLR